MREIGKSHKLDNVCYDIRGPVMDEAIRMESNGIDILKLNIGNPAPFGFKAPDEVIVDFIYNLRASEGYSNSKGLFSARKAIMQYCQLKGIPNVTVEDIYTGNGESELITMSMQGLLDDGDEILIPMPDYPLWTASVVLAGGKAVHYRCDEENHWYPDIEDIRRKVTPRTKGIVVINPNNPTGVVYSKEILLQIVDIAREHGLILFADEIYDRLVMDSIEFTPLASLAPDLFTVCFNGLSKSHRVAGFRSGWMCLAGDKTYVRGYIEGLNLLAAMRLCSNVPGQSVIQTAIGGYQSSDEMIKPGGRLFEQREFICKALNSIPGVSAVKPDAAFYVFPKFDTEMYGIKDDQEFVFDLLREQKLLVTAGTGFNWDKPDHLRIVYLARTETLEDAVTRLETFLKERRR
ncbi:MAG: pyridoxal phosphate-dependent aminotransferase [Clostridia bacterium]|nr:pyridoxal phosphate-dependent aminotransferase [Clostridia bacterium]MBO7549061.1 pyridoxal phosphate-dependent aminotransferase [Clostridia bacterium]